MKELLRTSTLELAERAREIRDTTYGTRITYSPKAFFPLTMLCRDRCGYCTFAKSPARLDSPFMTLDQVRSLAESAVIAGCREALFTLGEAPEDRYPVARSFLKRTGYDSTVAYLAEACRVALEEYDLLPHPNAGAISKRDLELLKEVSVSQGMMIESMRGDLESHRLAPDKSPARRVATIEAAGELRIPFTTGILVGIGEDESDRIDALLEIASLHRRFGHIQEVIVQNFAAKPRTAMAGAPEPSVDEFLRAVSLARLILPPDVHIQAPPNLFLEVEALVRAGIDDLGGISPLTPDHVNPEKPWPHLEALADRLSRIGVDLVPRTAVHPSFARDATWFDQKVQRKLLLHIDAEGLAREDAWVSGGLPEPKSDLLHRRCADRSSVELTEIFDAVEAGEELGEAEIVRLFRSRGDEVALVVEFADHLRSVAVGDVVTFVANRNINYTNICTFKCKFCGFSKGPLSLNLRGTPYLMGMEELAERVRDAHEKGATEVCLQGGIHPSFDAEYYIEVVQTVREACPSMHIHAFSALEVFEGARRAGLDLTSYLKMLKAAGLKTLPGTAAEILDDSIRAILCPDKINSAQWLEVHEAAHSVGLRSNVTIMFGAVEAPEAWARHLVRTRELQSRTGGFTEFVPLPFVHMASPIFLMGMARKGPTLREAVLMHAVGRIAYHGSIHHIQASWVKMGPKGASLLLRAGADDLGGTLIDENISHAAGSEHGKFLLVSDFKEIAHEANRPLHQRNTLYEVIETDPVDTPAYLDSAAQERSMQVKLSIRSR